MASVSPRQPEPPTFFIDRGLGRRHVPSVFTNAGYRVVLMSDRYPDGVAARFERHLGRIVHRSRRSGPWVDVVLRDRVERRWSAVTDRPYRR